MPQILSSPELICFLGSSHPVSVCFFHAHPRGCYITHNAFNVSLSSPSVCQAWRSAPYRHDLTLPSQPPFAVDTILIPISLMRKPRYRSHRTSWHQTWVGLAPKPMLPSLYCILSIYVPVQSPSLFLLITAETGCINNNPSLPHQNPKTSTPC